MLSPKTYSKITQIHSDAVFNFLNKNLKDRAMAEDLTQECFLKLWKNSLFLKEEVVKAWLFKTAYYLLLNYVRDNKRMDFLAGYDANDITFSSDSLEQSDWIETILSAMSVEQKSILLLRDQEAYSYKEIAEILNLTEENVKVKLFRARHRFKEIYELLKLDEKKLRYE